MIWGKICVHKRLLKLSTEAIINVLNDRPSVRSALFFLRNKRMVFLECDRGIFFEQTQKSIQNVIGVVFFLGGFCSRPKIVNVHEWETNEENCYECLQCKSCCHVLSMPFEYQKPESLVFGGNATYCFVKKTSRDYGDEKICHFLKTFHHQSQ